MKPEETIPLRGWLRTTFRHQLWVSALTTFAGVIFVFICGNFGHQKLTELALSKILSTEILSIAQAGDHWRLNQVLTDHEKMLGIHIEKASLISRGENFVIYQSRSADLAGDFNETSSLKFDGRSDSAPRILATWRIQNSNFQFWFPILLGFSALFFSTLINFGTARSFRRRFSKQIVRGIDQISGVRGEDEESNILEFSTAAYVVRNAKARETQLNSQIEIANWAGQLAHDLRTPVSILDTFSASFEDPEERTLFTQVIERFNTLTNDLLEKYRAVENGTGTSDTLNVGPSEQNLSNLLRQLRSEYSRVDPHARLNIEVGDGIRVPGGFEAWYRIFQNIVDNSRDALQSINRPLDMTFDFRTWRGKSALYIRDNGPGLPESVLDSLQKNLPIYSTKRTHGSALSTGLGLSSVRTSLASLGFTLEIINLPDRSGAEFWFVPS